MRLTKIVKQHKLHKHVSSQPKTNYNNEKSKLHILCDTCQLFLKISLDSVIQWNFKYKMIQNKLTSYECLLLILETMLTATVEL